MSYGLRRLPRVFSTVSITPVTPAITRHGTVLSHPILPSFVGNKEDSSLGVSAILRDRRFSEQRNLYPQLFRIHCLSKFPVTTTFSLSRAFRFVGRSSTATFPFHSPSLISASFFSSASSTLVLQTRAYSTPTPSPPPTPPTPPSPLPSPEEDIDNENENARQRRNSLYKRFKAAYENYGKVLIAVHATTYVMWFTSMTALSYCGIDVVPVLLFLHNNLGLPQSIIDAISKSGAGHFAVGFILTKVISPIRYITTIVGTKYAADFFRKRGYLKNLDQAGSFGLLAKDTKHEIGYRLKHRYQKTRKSPKDSRWGKWNNKFKRPKR